MDNVQAAEGVDGVQRSNNGMIKSPQGIAERKEKLLQDL
jgi:hypothetical protein